MGSAARFALAGAIACLMAVAGAAQYRLPKAQPPAAGQGAEASLVAAHCSACHSLDYISTQPPKMGQAFWSGEVQKMIAVYGAPIPADRAAAIAAYLAERH